MKIEWLIVEFKFKNRTSNIHTEAVLVEDELLMRKVVMDCLIQLCFMVPCSPLFE